MRACGGSSLNETSYAISASVIVLKVHVLLIAMGMILFQLPVCHVFVGLV